MNIFSVIVPSRTIDNLVACVGAIRKAGEACRIIVVDDGLPLEAFRGMDAEVALGIKPFCFARNVNLGIRAAGTDDVLILNDDALLVTPGGFTELAQTAEEHPEYGVIGAVTNVTCQPLQWRKDVGLRQVPYIAFVCVFIPRRTIDQIGLLDERYCLDYGVEDRDYCEVCLRAGLKVGVFDFCYVDHGRLTSTFRGDPKTPLPYAKNAALFQQKWGIGL